MLRFCLFALLTGILSGPTERNAADERSFGRAPEHPFLVVRTSEYPALQRTSGQWPWWVMKMKAIETVTAPRPGGTLSYYRKALRTYTLGSACALTYILDKASRKTVVERVEGEIRSLIHDLRTGKELGNDPLGHGLNVTPAHAAFMTYILLDIVYDGLNARTRKAMEDDCDYIAGHHANSWFESKYAIEAFCELYHNGCSEEFVRRKDLYRNYLLRNTSDDGVYVTGPGYAHSRLFMEERAQKKIFMDVCEYQGFHEFYSEPKFRKLYEWLFGYSVTPCNRTYTFGDTPPTKEFNEYSSAVMRVDRFSEAAQGFAVWYLGPATDDRLEGGILPYLFCDANVFEKRQPTSRIFRNGGAWLLQKEYTPKALAGVLWNVSTASESHSHFDVNSINIEGFGEHILRNSGYDGWAEPDSARWEWIHHNARSSNTLTIGGENHADCRGGGIQEGIVGFPIEYASGLSGPSLRGATHARDLMFVQPRDDLPGYFVVIDEVETERPSQRVDIFFHPNSKDAPAVADSGRQYQWPIKSCTGTEGVNVRIALVSRPDAVAINRGYFGSIEECNRFWGSYIRATYDSGPGGRTAMASVIFPFPAEAAPPPFENISSSRAEGLRIQIGGTVDYLIVPRKGKNFAGYGVQTEARAVYWRGDSYFVRHGTRFLQEGRGFESDSAVTAVMAGDRGDVISPGTMMTFRRPGITAISVDGAPAPIRGSGEGFVRISLPAGNHRVEVIAGPLPPR